MTYINNEPTFFAPSVTQTPPAFTFTFTAGTGPSCTLTHDGRSVFWQGDEAEGIIRLVERDGEVILPQVWDEYEHVAE